MAVFPDTGKRTQEAQKTGRGRSVPISYRTFAVPTSFVEMREEGKQYRKLWKPQHTAYKHEQGRGSCMCLGEQALHAEGEVIETAQRGRLLWGKGRNLTRYVQAAALFLFTQGVLF